MQRSDFLIKLISVILFVAIVLYLGFSIISSTTAPIKTVEAVRAAVENSGSAVGYAVREESVLKGGGSTVSVQVDEGSKVSSGGIIAIGYSGTAAMERASRLRELKLRAEQLESTGSTALSAQNAWNSIIALSQAVQRREFAELDSLELNIRMHVQSTGNNAAADAELAAIRSEISQLESYDSTDTRKIRSDASGIFSSVVDGFEHISPDDLSGLTPGRLDSMFSTPAQVTDTTIGKLVTDIRWYYAAKMNESDALRLKSVVTDSETGEINSGRTVTVEFTKAYKATLEMRVESIGEAEKGKCVVVLSADRGLEDAVGERTLTAEIIFESFSGIRVPREALHEDENGVFVFIVTGLQAEQVYIELIGYDDEYVFVLDGAETGGALRQGSEIVIKGEDLSDGKVVRG